MRRDLSRYRTRTLSIGYASGSTGPATEHVLPTELLRRAAALDLAISICVYPPIESEA